MKAINVVNEKTVVMAIITIMVSFILIAIVVNKTCERRIEKKASACQAIQNPDYRQTCIAVARNNMAICYAIQEPSIREECRADVL